LSNFLIAQTLTILSQKAKESVPMLWTIALVLVVLWALGLIGNIGGGLVHILLVLAVIVIVVNLLSRRRGTG
jgi:hypothetical protein